MLAALFLCALLSTGVQAQFEVYKTVDDMTNKTPQTYPGFDLDSEKGGKKDTKIELKNNATKEKVEIDCSAIWGFSYKGQLFRIVKLGKYYNSTKAPQNMPVQLLLNKDGAFYWLNDGGLLSYVKDAAEREASGKPAVPFYFEFQSYQGYLSSSVDGDMMAVLGGKYLGTPKWVGVAQDEFMKDNPDLKWLKTCAMSKKWNFWGKHYTHSVVRDCINEHVAPDK